MFEALLPGRFCSDDPIGELLWPLGNFGSAPGFISVVCGAEGSDSFPGITASRLLETATLLDDPLDHKKLELDGCIDSSGHLLITCLTLKSVKNIKLNSNQIRRFNNINLTSL